MSNSSQRSSPPLSKGGITAVDQPSTASALIATLRDHPDLSEPRRRTLLWSVNRLCGLVHKDPDLLRPSATELRPALAQLHPATTGLSAGTLADLRSSMRAAMRLTGERPAPRPAMSGPWTALLAQLHPHIKYGDVTLSRFARWASAAGLGPEDVTDADFQGFKASLVAETLLAKPLDTAWRTARMWNRARKLVAGWPQAKLHWERRRPLVSVAYDELPLSLRQDFEAWLSRTGGDDLFDPLCPDRPRRPSTIEGLRWTMRKFYTPIARGAVSVGPTGDLAALIRPAVVRDVLTYWLDRNGGQPNDAAHRMARLAITIARQWAPLEPGELEVLRNYERRLRRKPTGMASKNRLRLAQFDDRRSLERLLGLPIRVMTELRASGDISRPAALRAQMAAAVAILLMLPLRISNLANLELGRHLVRSRVPGSRDMHLLIEPDEVKNGRPIEARLPPFCVDLIDFYLGKYARRLSRNRGPFLFAGRSGTKARTGLGTQISGFVRRETGLQVNPHLFRHLAAKIYLDRHPTDYETVRKLLGHRNINTTISFYISMSDVAAIARFDEIILGLLPANQN